MQNRILQYDGSHRQPENPTHRGETDKNAVIDRTVHLWYDKTRQRALVRVNRIENERSIMELYLAERLKKYRKEKDMTQEALAQVIGVSPQSVSKWECGVSLT